MSIEPRKDQMSESFQLKEKNFTNGPPYFDPTIEKIKKLIEKFGYTALIVNRLDYYGNGIPIGAFCNAISFILYGFHRCLVYKDNDTFLWAVILLFGGVGQITAGFFEFIKGRSFTTCIYLTYGFYCLTHYVAYVLPMKLGEFDVYGLTQESSSLSCFYGAWLLLSIPIVVASIKTNIFFVIQSAVTTVFFFIRCLGEGIEKYSLVRHTAGILEVIAGFVSLYIFLNQLINEQFRYQFLPSFPLNPDNEIDINPEYYGTPN